MIDAFVRSEHSGPHSAVPPQQFEPAQPYPGGQSSLELQVGKPAQGVLPCTQTPEPFGVVKHTQSPPPTHAGKAPQLPPAQVRQASGGQQSHESLWASSYAFWPYEDTAV